MKYIYLLLCWAIISQPCIAQDTPEAVVDTYFERVASGGINQIGSLMHPDELSKFRSMMAPIVSQALSSPGEAEAFAIFADSSNAQQMKSFSSVAFMNTFMEWIVRMQPGFTEVFKNATVETLGHVIEGEKKHVVVRMTMSVEGIEIEKMTVLSIKDFNGQPRMMLTGEMKGVAEALQQR